MVDERELENGLTQAEAERRLKKYGANLLENKKRISPVKIFFSQFNDFITWILIVATVISGFMGEKADAITILIIIIMNAILGFVQEFKTERSLETLKELAEGKVDILIGTHQLVNKNVVFKDLGLLVIDEEQKFGVAVKDKLKTIGDKWSYLQRHLII